jgi:DNA-binding Lrp family transcriptional regulator
MASRHADEENFYEATMSATKVRATTSPPGSLTHEIDRTDKAILRSLQRDASLSNVGLAAKVNLSAPACLRRVERLKQMGLITGIVALLNPRALDAGMLVMIGVVLDRSTPDSFADFEKAAAKVSGCMECHIVTGEFDYFMLLRTRDSDSFNRLHAEQLLHLPGVRQIRSFMVLKQVLSTTQFPI